MYYKCVWAFGTVGMLVRVLACDQVRLRARAQARSDHDSSTRAHTLSMKLKVGEGNYLVMFHALHVFS